jgi:hypothetical protein
MRPLRVVAALFLFSLGIAAPAFAQEEHPEAAKPAPHQEEMKPAPHPETAAPAPHQEARPVPRPQEAPPSAHPEEAKPAPHPQNARPANQQNEMKPAPHPEQARPVPQQQEVRPVPQTSRPVGPAHEMQGSRPQPTAEQRHVQQTAWQPHRAQHWQSEHRTWQERGGYHGYRIPDERYHQYFGPSHAFAIYTVPVVVYGGYPRFQYSGFWFNVVDPWPEYWAADWYDTDDVYILYSDGGYYLVDQRYPGVMLAVDVAV